MKRGETFHRLRLFLIDVVAPIAAYYGLRAIGVAELPALLARSGVAAADALISLAIERHVHPLQVLVCVMFALTGGLAFATHDPRRVLVPGVILLVSLVLIVRVNPAVIRAMADATNSQDVRMTSESW